MPDTLDIVPEAPVIIINADKESKTDGIYNGGNTISVTHFSKQAYLNNMIMDKTPDWFFFIIIVAVLSLAWVKLIYTKFVFDFISSVFNYNISVKIYNEAGIVRKRVGYYLNILYLLTGSLYLFAISRYFDYSPFELRNMQLFFLCFCILFGFIFYRILITKIISFIFLKEGLFSEFIHHFYVYNKLLGLVLLPFLLLIPYSNESLQQIFVYLSFAIITSLYILRIFRIITFIFKKEVLLFYLFLYLCTLEILPVLVITRIFLSLI